MATFAIHFRCGPVTAYSYNYSIYNVSLILGRQFLLLKNDPLPSTYWMAGLASDAAHFFKFLFILVLYTLAMTLFVSIFQVCASSHFFSTHT